MKVLLVTPYAGMTNPYTELLARALRSAGIELRVAAGTRLFTVLAAVLRHGRPDIVHLQWHHPYITARNLPLAALRTLLFGAQWLLLRLLGSRIVWTVHNIVSHERRQEQWELRVSRVFARAAAALIVHCPAAVPAVAAAYRVRPERVRVVPHGHYIGRYPEAAGRVAARAALGLTSEVRVLLFFGNVRRYKGLEQLLEAFMALDGRNLRLILLGQARSPVLGRALMAQAAADPRVDARFEFVPDAELASYLAACDVVVLPYTDSLTSGAAVLAASCGRPILAPALGCMSDFPSEAAILYDPLDPDGLRRGLERAIHASLDAMGDSALRYVEGFPWSLVAQRTEVIYHRVLPARAGRTAPAG